MVQKNILAIPTLFGFSIEVYIIVLILAIPVYFFWRSVLGIWIKDIKRKNKIAIVFSLAATPLIYGTIILAIVLASHFHPSQKFDKEKWKNDVEHRYIISEELIESKLLIGKSKAEVLELLGEETDDQSSDLWTYFLGYKPGFGNIDPDVLDIRFRNGRVVEVNQHGT